MEGPASEAAARARDAESYARFLTRDYWNEPGTDLLTAMTYGGLAGGVLGGALAWSMFS